MASKTVEMIQKTEQALGKTLAGTEDISKKRDIRKKLKRAQRRRRRMVREATRRQGKKADAAES